MYRTVFYSSAHNATVYGYVMQVSCNLLRYPQSIRFKMILEKLQGIASCFLFTVTSRYRRPMADQVSTHHLRLNHSSTYFTRVLG